MQSNVAQTNSSPTVNSFVPPIPTNVSASDDMPTLTESNANSLKRRRSSTLPDTPPKPETIFTEAGYKVKTRDSVAHLPLDDEDRAMAELELGREMAHAVARGIDPTILARRFFEGLLKDPHFSVSCSSSSSTDPTTRPVLKIAPDLSDFLDGFTRLNLQKIGAATLNYQRYMRKEVMKLPDFSSMNNFVSWNLVRGRWIDTFGGSQKEDISNESFMIYRLRSKDTRIFKEQYSSVKSESASLSSIEITFNVLKKITLWQMIRLQDVGIFLNDSHLFDAPNSRTLEQLIETLRKGFVWHGSMIRIAYRRKSRQLRKWTAMGLLPQRVIFRDSKLLKLK
ncbi:hypothetical protein PRIPAC_97129 [Pristionchus pacificus]|uniref:Uncharacterized protein n=1 Tax=Pristionchus pacificus TaxID=54126 RepID=A0A2A6BBX8_PRIPA|nr:hypothetical protein PRIPAC_97129 [Pristionchus pacificus]|eukprot:PDM63379.1 hypothetical protein PRIPAC_53736 [Pristionchus pacificus]